AGDGRGTHQGQSFFHRGGAAIANRKRPSDGVRGAYRLTAPVTSLDVPASVQAVLASRIDRLAEREKQALQTASVIGKQFSETLLRQVLASIAPLDEVALDQALSALVAAEFLYEA